MSLYGFISERQVKFTWRTACVLAVESARATPHHLGRLFHTASPSDELQIEL